ncbi:MAG: hypothetical protein AAF738_03340, partial [Bacteroidota bacterium]
MIRSFYLLLLLPYFLVAENNCHPDYDALMALYNATDGDNWTNKTGWEDGAQNTNCDVCTWYGVTCGFQGRVFQLQLMQNNLNGTLPAAIGSLSTLSSLTIAENPRLSGAIPAQITNLRELIFLSLDQNQLTGTIPVQMTRLSK